MKKVIMILALVYFYGLLLPFFAVGGTQRALQAGTQPVAGQADKGHGGVSLGGGTQSEREVYSSVSVYLCDKNEVVEMPVEEYLYGVVSAEMPASYPLEALKAQAVAARTYTVFLINRQRDDPARNTNLHHGADVCTDPNHCQGYLSLEEARKSRGEGWIDSYYGKIKSAVDETAGEILYYMEEPIVAVFHAMSGGRTEKASDVWGGDYPYLTGVDSSGDLFEGDFESRVSVGLEAFKQIISDAYPQAVFEGEPSDWVNDLKRTQAGGVDSLKAGGVIIKGSEIRKLFSLRSANFALSFKEETIEFIVRGYGHGVGMSQTGAAWMARQGKTYEDILAWYYTGAKLGSFLDGK